MTSVSTDNDEYNNSMDCIRLLLQIVKCVSMDNDKYKNRIYILHAAIATNDDKKKKKIITVTTKLSQRKKIQRKCEIEKKKVF